MHRAEPQPADRLDRIALWVLEGKWRNGHSTNAAFIQANAVEGATFAELSSLVLGRARARELFIARCLMSSTHPSSSHPATHERATLEGANTWIANAWLNEGEFVVALARKLAGDMDEAEDIAQETWLVALRRRAGASRPSRAWLAAVVSNIAAERRRDRTRRIWEEWHAAIEHGASSMDQEVFIHSAHDEVRAATLALREPYRSTIELRFYAGLAARDVARAQGVSVETVQTRTKRALRLLRRQVRADASCADNRASRS